MQLPRTLLVSLLLPALCFAEKLPWITQAEAITLIEQKTGPLTSVDPMAVRSGIAFIDAKSDVGSINAMVNLDTARVMAIKTDGKETYVFPGVIAVGHRGTVKFAPENTIAAFNKAIELGVDLLEMDVRETKDGELVIMHDMNIGRTTTGRGDVAELTLAAIQQYDAGSKHDPKFAGEKAPTFAAVLEAIKGRALPDIDFKAGDPQKVIDAVRAAGLVGKCTLYCGDWAKLHKTLELEKGFIIRPTAPKGIEGLEKVIAEFDPPIVNMDWVDFSEEFVRAIHLRGKLAFVNTMGKSDGEESIRRAVRAGADYVQSDQLDLLVKLVR
ncbi:MAG: glycerophosphodiester phosphodiesterase family protein [Candidatus Hydrogenedentes bacterium]|nr:glycerophosphodiester phosphodiesterase family protein [Candidatus Hydrogenedentota bacterium]